MAPPTKPASSGAPCPLLDLPPELRLRIYRYLLGGCTVHFDSPESNREASVLKAARLCKLPKFDKESFDLLGSDPKYPPNTFTIATGHERCKAAPAEAIKTDLLLVCRQIYQEARLIAFKENRFTISSPLSALDLPLRLTASQWKTITTVTVYQSGFHKEWRAVDRGDVVSPLPGIKNLRVFIELRPGNLRHADSIVSIAAQDKFVGRMGMFRSSKLKDVEILINNTKTRRLKKLSPAEIEAWSIRIKNVLLPTECKVESG